MQRGLVGQPKKNQREKQENSQSETKYKLKASRLEISFNIENSSGFKVEEGNGVSLQ